MPAIGLVGLISLLSAAAGVGSTIYSVEENKSAQADQKSLLNQQQQQQAKQQLISKQEAEAAAAPNAQYLTGGSLTGPAGQSFTDILAGYPGSTGGASPTKSATNASPSISPGTSADYSSILSSLLGNSGSTFEGGWKPQAPQEDQFSLTGGFV